MSNLADKIIWDVLHRAPTAEDYRRLNEMLKALPSEMTSSPGAMYDLVLRMDYLRQLEETIAKAGQEAQQRIHHDLPGRIDQAAIKALLKIRDSLPIDAAHSAKRLYKITAIGTAFLAMLFGGAGWVLGANSVKNEFATTHATSDRELYRCVDAATGAFVSSARRDNRSAPVTADMVRNDIMLCGAEYADRRAQGS